MLPRPRTESTAEDLDLMAGVQRELSDFADLVEANRA